MDLGHREQPVQSFLLSGSSRGDEWLEMVSDSTLESGLHRGSEAALRSNSQGLSSVYAWTGPLASVQVGVGKQL